ncbi:NAD(P)/FAD-dependent oxidoreductase [Methanoregula sp.]|uniref:NAD(P)/FAD-dependent oxidoreductase n=1 Tax=Methanoregula sp. TaxID=2052170 RepID=UPI003C734C46
MAIIGTGPAGLFCAIHAAGPGRRIVLFEKNAEPGRKLLLAGSGQCNITHAGEITGFVTHYGSHGRFLKPALMGYSNQALIRFFTDRGLAMVTEENGKVFPETRSSADVLRLLIQECGRRGVEIRCGEPVTGIAKGGAGFTITSEKGTHCATNLVITTGGASYPKTGSAGDGYRLAAALGQPVTEIAPALAPLLVRPFLFAGLAGISFEGTRFTVWRDGKKVGDHTGDVLFTHLGLSGPGILDASRAIRPGDLVRLSFVGTMRREEFAADLAKRAAENTGWQVSTILAKYPIPERLNRKLLQLSGIPEELKGSQFSGEMRAALVTNCTEFPFPVERLGDFAVAMATRGGVALEQVNPKTMESKLVPGLFFAGEVLDIDGDTGGYNLQAAFSTGHCAAMGIGKRAEAPGR